MKNNEGLQKDVQDALKWEPLLHAAEIGVTVKDGIVTLTGMVDSYIKKTEAEDAAKKVAGVKAVVENITVKFGEWGPKTDEEIAKEVLNALKWSWQVPSDKITVKVENGWVTLQGLVSWNYQKDAAKSAVKNLLGVKGFINSISIESEVKDEVEKQGIEAAIRRNWAINEENVHVKVAGNKVTLSGTVSSVYQKDEVARIAWKAPGVWFVENELQVVYDFSLVD